MLQVTFYEALKELTEYGKQKVLPGVEFDVTNSFEGLVLGGVAGGMPFSVLVDFFLVDFFISLVSQGNCINIKENYSIGSSQAQQGL